MSTVIKVVGLVVVGPVRCMAKVDDEGVPYTAIRHLRSDTEPVSGTHPRVNDGRTSSFRGGLNAYVEFNVLIPLPTAPRHEQSSRDPLGSIFGFGRQPWPH